MLEPKIDLFEPMLEPKLLNTNVSQYRLNMFEDVPSADLFNPSIQFLCSINCCKTHTKQMNSRTTIREKFKALDRTANVDKTNIQL